MEECLRDKQSRAQQKTLLDSLAAHGMCAALMGGRKPTRALTMVKSEEWRRSRKKKKREKKEKKEESDDDDEWVEAGTTVLPCNKVVPITTNPEATCDEFSIMFGDPGTACDQVSGQNEKLELLKSRELNKCVLDRESGEDVGRDHYESLEQNRSFHSWFHKSDERAAEQCKARHKTTPAVPSLSVSNKTLDSLPPGEVSSDGKASISLQSPSSIPPPAGASLDERNKFAANNIRTSLGGEDYTAPPGWEKRFQEESPVAGHRDEADDHKTRVIFKENSRGELIPLHLKRCGDRPSLNESLQDMVREERMVTPQDLHRPLLRMSKATYSAVGWRNGLESRFTPTSKQKRKQEASEAAMIRSAITETKRAIQVVDSCEFCCQNRGFAGNLVTRTWEKAFLMIPSFRCVVPDQLYIVPTLHDCALTYCDQDVIIFIRSLKDALCSLFETKNKIPIFMETFFDLRHKSHCFLDVIPIDKDLLQESRSYFKKSIMESDNEWLDNKALIELRRKDCVSEKIPKGFPYFTVEFGREGGYAHVIENNKRFTRHFGYEVIGGLLDVDPTIWLKRKHDSTEGLVKRILHLKNFMNYL